MNRLSIDQNNGYFLHEWIKSELEDEIENEIQILTSELDEINNKAMKVKNRIEEMIKVRESVNCTVRYLELKRLNGE